MYTIINTTLPWLLLLILLPINLFRLSVSHTIVNSLPGFPGQLPFKLETGYVGVGKEESVQLFYYSVESERNPRDDPIILSIPGGPGSSALRTFFYQFGPVEFDYENSVGKLPQLKLRQYRWTRVASIIYVDPPRTGFSYATTAEANKTSDSMTVEILYEFLRKWLLDHPKHTNNPLYINGISYAGIVVPALAQRIIDGNEEESIPKLNFKSARAHCNSDYIHVNPENELCSRSLEKVDECLDGIYPYNILEPICISDELTSRRMLQQQTSHSNTADPLRSPVPQGWCREDTYEYATFWANDRSVRKALNIREETIQEWVHSNSDHYWLGKNDTDTYKYDIQSSLIYHRNLTKKVARALIYSGDHDMVFPYIGTRKWIHTLKLNVDRHWTKWLVNNQVAGYTETFSHNNYSLTYATVKGAGHSAPEYKSEQCLAMIDRWFSYTNL